APLERSPLSLGLLNGAEPVVAVDTETVDVARPGPVVVGCSAIVARAHQNQGAKDVLHPLPGEDGEEVIEGCSEVRRGAEMERFDALVSVVLRLVVEAENHSW